MSTPLFRHKEPLTVGGDTAWKITSRASGWIAGRTWFANHGIMRQIDRLPLASGQCHHGKRLAVFPIEIKDLLSHGFSCCQLCESIDLIMVTDGVAGSFRPASRNPQRS